MNYYMPNTLKNNIALISLTPILTNSIALTKIGWRHEIYRKAFLLTFKNDNLYIALNGSP